MSRWVLFFFRFIINKYNGHPKLGLGRGQTRPHLCRILQKRGGRAHRRAARGEGWAQGTGDLSRIGYALGGTRARLGVLCLCSPPDPSLSGTKHLTTHRRGLASGRAAGQGW
jgi:hypothetical protein